MPRRLRVHALALIAWLLLVAGGLVACGGDRDAEVVATVPPVAALAREVVRSTPLRVASIVPPGVDPHDFGPSPEDVRQARGAKVVLRGGLGLDDFVTSMLGDARTMTTVTASIAPREGDPHVWHDVAHAQVMVDSIVTAASTAYPNRADTFRANGAAYRAKLDAVDAQIRQLFEGIPAANRKIVTDHDAFGYFFARYGLTSVGAVIPSASGQGDTSARAIARLQDTIRREGARVILSAQSVDPKVARELAKDTGVKIVSDLYGDSLGKPGSGQDTIDGMLLYNARKIAEALR